MKVKTLLYFASFLILCTLVGCKNKVEKSIINNPVTANNEEGVIRKEDPEGPKIKFDHVTYDFGNVYEGEKMSHVFTFTNTGKSPLLISSTSASCGCTSSSVSKAPIKPGESSSIEVFFDSKGKNGDVTNTVRVASNAYPSPAVLTIKAHVKKM